MFKNPFLSLALILLLNSLPSAALAEGRHLRIGVTTALTGSMSPYGEAFRRGVMLADQLHDKDKRVEFVIEDDGFLTRNTVTSVRKFLSQGHLDGLMVFGSGPSLAAAPLAEAQHVPMVGFATAPELAVGKKYVLRHLAAVSKENAAVVAEVKKRGYKKVALVSTSQEGMLALRDSFRQTSGTEIIVDEEVNPGESDISSLASRTALKQPDAVYNLLLPPNHGLFARLLRQYGFKGEMFGPHTTEDPGEVAASHGALKGTWFASLNAVKDSGFSEAYKKIYGSEPPPFVSHGYDVARMYIEGVDAPSLIDYLRSLTHFTGAMGTYGVTADNEFDVPVLIKTVTDTGFTPLNP